MVGDVLLQTVDDHNPDAIAIEELFFSVNAKTALRVAEVRGALLYLSASRSLPIIEFNPSAVKIATTGYGKATKAQVTEMVARLIGISIKGKLDDEIDAIALGITALAHHRSDVVNRVS
jgi:crossover junction endodeoxyribonuclease RuvC